MAYKDYVDLMEMTEDLLKYLCREIYGSEHVMVPVFDIDGKENSEKKFVELDFRTFQKFDVMTEIGVDPEMLDKPEELQIVLVQKLKELLQSIKNKDKAKKLDRDLHNLNHKQLIDALIENIIEVKC